MEHFECQKLQMIGFKCFVGYDTKFAILVAWKGNRAS